MILFTCATSRAVHLDIISDLSAETSLNAFRGSRARRPYPKLIISDNATNFTLGSDLLKWICEDDRVQEFYIKGCEWKFITPSLDFFERMIGTFKSCLRNVFFRKSINMDDILSYVTYDLGEPEELTLSHLLHGYRLISLLAVSTSI